MDYKSYRTKPLAGLKAAVQKLFFVGNLEATETSNISLNIQGSDMAGAFLVSHVNFVWKKNIFRGLQKLFKYTQVIGRFFSLYRTMSQTNRHVLALESKRLGSVE